MPSSSDRKSASERISFHQPGNSNQLLDALLQGVSVNLRGPILTLLGTVPDPDSAVLFLERLLHDAAAKDLLEHTPVLAYYAVTIFGRSPYLSETLVQNPDVLAELASQRSLDR